MLFLTYMYYYLIIIYFRLMDFLNFLPYLIHDNKMFMGILFDQIYHILHSLMFCKIILNHYVLY